MLVRALWCFVISASVTQLALAANEIEEWGDREIGEFEIVGSFAIVIKAGGAFHFHATDPEDPTGLGVINSVTVDANAQIEGPIYLYIHRDPNDVGGDPCSPGAKAVYTMDLTANSATGHLVYLNVLYNLGYSGGTIVDYADTIVVGTDLYDLTAIDITGPVTVSGWLRGTIDCHSMMDLDVLGGSDPNSDVLVESSYGYNMYINGPMDDIVIGDDDHLCSSLEPNATIVVRGTLDKLYIWNGLQGVVEVGDPNGDPNAVIEECREVRMYWMSDSGSVTVYGDAGDIWSEDYDNPNDGIAGVIDIKRDLLGSIYEWGGPMSGEVRIGGRISVLASVWISGAISGSVWVGGDAVGYADETKVYCYDLPGMVTIEGSMQSGWLEVDGMPGLEQVGNLSGTVTIGNLTFGSRIVVSGDENEGYLSGHVVVPGTVEEADEAAVSCSNDLSGTLEIATLYGTVQTQSDLTGTITVGYLAGVVDIDGLASGEIEIDTLDGEVTIGQDLTSTGDILANEAGGIIHIGGSAAGVIQIGTLDGDVEIQQNLTGTIVLDDVAGTVDVEGLLRDPNDDLTRYQGSIQVNGALRSTGVIEVGGFDPNDGSDGEFITCADYDGYDGDPNQMWEEDGVVQIGSRFWTGWPGPNWGDPNHPWYFNVFATTCCVADVNGDQRRNFADTNAFVDALNSFNANHPDWPPDPSSAFGRNWPGRAGSWYHADCDGDGQVNLADTDDFAALLSDSNCPVDCPAQQDRGESLPNYEPAELAKQFRAHVTADRLGTLAIAIGHVATAEKGDRKVYWTQVYGELTK